MPECRVPEGAKIYICQQKEECTQILSLSSPPSLPSLPHFPPSLSPSLPSSLTAHSWKRFSCGPSLLMRERYWNRVSTISVTCSVRERGETREGREERDKESDMVVVLKETLQKGKA